MEADPAKKQANGVGAIQISAPQKAAFSPRPGEHPAAPSAIPPQAQPRPPAPATPRRSRPAGRFTPPPRQRQPAPRTIGQGNANRSMPYRIGRASPDSSRTSAKPAAPVHCTPAASRLQPRAPQQKGQRDCRWPYSPGLAGSISGRRQNKSFLPLPVINQIPRLHARAHRFNFPRPQRCSRIIYLSPVRHSGFPQFAMNSQLMQNG